MRPTMASSDLLPILALLALAGCATAPAQTADVATVCLPIVSYSASDQKEFAREVNALDPAKDAQVIRFLGDYKAMRDADRACQTSGGH